jgi:CRISPR-associated protein Csm4
MGLILCKLEPRAPLHLGIKEAILEETSEYIHSDTLFSAICNACLLLQGKNELEALLAKFRDRNPPFLISSAFPFIKEILLFPLPKSIDFSKYSSEPKKFKRVEFISEEIFRAIIANREINKYITTNNLLQNKRILATIEEVKLIQEAYKVKNVEELKFWVKREVPRVVIDRKTNKSNIYHFGEVVFTRNCGLYFLIRTFNGFKEKYEKMIKACLHLLMDEGIGGDRTYGKGLFKRIKFNAFSIDLESKDYFITLSQYHPRKEEVSYVKEGYYELVNRGGWIYSPNGRNMRRKTIRMLTEGSVVKSHNEPYGSLTSVKPDEFTAHEVYRYGYAFPIPIEVKQ